MANSPLDKIIINKLFGTIKGKNFHRRGLQHNISEIKMNFLDHSVRFNPHDSIGARIYSSGTHTRKPIDRTNRRNSCVGMSSWRILQRRSSPGSISGFSEVSGLLDEFIT